MVALFFLLLSVSLSLAQEWDPSLPTNRFAVEVTQDYIISPDVIAEGGIVANSIGDFVDSDDLPADYPEWAEVIYREAVDDFLSTQRVFFSDYGGFIVDDQFNIIFSSTSTTFFTQYGYQETNIPVSPLDFIPTNNLISRLLPSFNSSSNYNFGIVVPNTWREFQPSTRVFTFKLNLQQYGSLFPNIDIRFDPVKNDRFASFAIWTHRGFKFMWDVLTWCLVVVMVRKTVSVFVGGEDKE